MLLISNIERTRSWMEEVAEIDGYGVLFGHRNHVPLYTWQRGKALKEYLEVYQCTVFALHSTKDSP